MIGKQYQSYKNYSNDLSPQILTRNQQLEHQSRQLKKQIENISKSYNGSNYFHVGPRRKLIKIATKLAEEYENVNSYKNKIAKLESELLNLTHQSTISELELHVTKAELSNIQHVCENLNSELEETKSTLEQIHTLSKKRQFSDI